MPVILLKASIGDAYLIIGVMIILRHVFFAPHTQAEVGIGEVSDHLRDHIRCTIRHHVITVRGISHETTVTACGWSCTEYGRVRAPRS